VYKPALYIFFLLLSFFNYAQNLVMNPSFEEYWICPTNTANVKDCKYVFDPQCVNEPLECLSSSDYYNTCAPAGSNVSVPNSFTGFQLPKSGDGFVGSGIHDTTGYREYVQLKLAAPLITNNFYNFSFYINLADCSHVTTYAVGVKFVSDSVLFLNQYLWEIMEADWMNDENNYITDTVNWTKLEGTYQASGGEQWVIVGIFYPEKHVPVMIINPIADSSWHHFGYYYYDDFNVEVLPLNLPNVFTPNNDGVNDTWFTNGNIKEVTIFNRWGNLVHRSTQGFSGWDGNTQEGMPCSEGVYFYVLIEEHPLTKKETQHSGFITLLR
jgi:OOP family OmpA-OmpF porin